MPFPPDAADIAAIDATFPDLRSTGYTVTSPQDPFYNCIGWAAGDDDTWWWPSGYGGHYWPHGAPLEATLDAFRIAFGGIGYNECADGDLEEGVEKVAIYVGPTGEVLHGSRQLESGAWTSKLGPQHDIEHLLPEGVNSDLYGVIGMFLSRPRA